jgi:hypothetical protein
MQSPADQWQEQGFDPRCNKMLKRCLVHVQHTLGLRPSLVQSWWVNVSWMCPDIFLKLNIQFVSFNVFR